MIRVGVVGLLFALAGCGSRHSVGDDEPDSGFEGSGAADGAGNDGDNGNGHSPPQAVPLVECGSSVEIAPTLATAIDFHQFASADDAPLEVSGDRARLFYSVSGDVMTSAHGSAQTVSWASELTGADFVIGQTGISGRTAVKFYLGTTAAMSVVDGQSFAPPIAIPCTEIRDHFNCEVRVAGDGHVWISTGQQLYEQTGSTFADRGGAPVIPIVFDVAWNGDVLIAGYGTGSELLQMWKLPAGGVGWIKTTSMVRADLGSAADILDGGMVPGTGVFFFDNRFGTFAPDGSIHVFTSARTDLGANQTRVYLRSNGAGWAAETIPDIGTFTDGQATSNHIAFWASDYNNIRFVNMSVPTASTSYRQLNAIARCIDGNQQPRFERIAKVSVPGFGNGVTARGFAEFSNTGALTFLTTTGLTQVYR